MGLRHILRRRGPALSDPFAFEFAADDAAMSVEEALLGARTAATTANQRIGEALGPSGGQLSPTDRAVIDLTYAVKRLADAVEQVAGNT